MSVLSSRIDQKTSIWKRRVQVSRLSSFVKDDPKMKECTSERTEDRTIEAPKKCLPAQMELAVPRTQWGIPPGMTLEIHWFQSLTIQKKIKLTACHLSGDALPRNGNNWLYHHRLWYMGSRAGQGSRRSKGFLLPQIGSSWSNICYLPESIPQSPSHRSPHVWD